MYGYAATSATTTAQATPFSAAPQTTNVAGLAAQGGANAQTAAASTGTGVQSVLSQLVSLLPTSLQSLASPSGISDALSGILGGSSSGSSGSGFLGGINTGSLIQGVIGDYLSIPGWMGMFMANEALGPLMQTPISNALTSAMTPAAAGAADAASAAEGAAGIGDMTAGLGGFTGLGQAASVGGLTVPPSWGWAASGPSGMLGEVPFLAPLAAADGNFATGLGFPMMLGGLPRGATAGSGGAAAAKYGIPVAAAVMARPPAAGYGPAASAAPIPAPAEIAPPVPGYRPAIVYLPTNGHAPAKT